MRQKSYSERRKRTPGEPYPRSASRKTTSGRSSRKKSYGMSYPTTNSERPFDYFWMRTNTSTRQQSPTKRSPKPSHDIFTRPCSKRRNVRKRAKAPNGWFSAYDPFEIFSITHENDTELRDGGGILGINPEVGGARIAP